MNVAGSVIGIIIETRISFDLAFLAVLQMVVFLRRFAKALHNRLSVSVILFFI